MGLYLVTFAESANLASRLKLAKIPGHQVYPSITGTPRTEYIIIREDIRPIALVYGAAQFNGRLMITTAACTCVKRTKRYEAILRLDSLVLCCAAPSLGTMGIGKFPQNLGYSGKCGQQASRAAILAPSKKQHDINVTRTRQMDRHYLTIFTPRCAASSLLLASSWLLYHPSLQRTLRVAARPRRLPTSNTLCK
jgi:hypothetical protein